MKKKGFTLIELLVVIAIIAMLLAILMPALNKVKKIAQRVVCGTNLKGMGNAQTVYSNDFDGQYVCHGQGGPHTWGENTAGWQNPTQIWSPTGVNITVGSSLYLLVRLADVSPKSFVCPASDQTEFSGKNGNNRDIVELWDFGTETAGTGWDAEGPAKCVSYSYHNPYSSDSTPTGRAGRFRADDTRSAAFAVMADKNPWYDPKLTDGTYNGNNLNECKALIFPHWGTGTPTTGTVRQNIMVTNAQAHEREGQNVMFADGHNSFEKTSDVGVKNDNIYTAQPLTLGGPYTWRAGTAVGLPDRAGIEETPQRTDDSMLVNDFFDGSIVLNP